MVLCLFMRQKASVLPFTCVFLTQSSESYTECNSAATAFSVSLLITVLVNYFSFIHNVNSLCLAAIRDVHSL